MIVHPAPDGLELITQPDHAHLARAIMEHCADLQSRPRRESILYAIGEHDNGWEEEDAAPTVNPVDGTIADFVTAPLGMRHAVWPRGVARLARDPWAAALVAQHAITVYDRFRPDPDWTRFFSEMECARDAMLRASGLSRDELLLDYPFVRLGDLISLTFCTGWTAEQRYDDWTVVRSGTSVLVKPDPFGGVTIPFEIHARALPAGTFRTDADLRNALGRAPTITLSGQVAATRFAA